jgi:hypothetical protein
MPSATFHVDLDSVEDSNLFLRALWAQLRTFFGHLAWQYTPHRDGPHRRIIFGLAQIGGDGPIEVSIGYGRAGCIRTITFNPFWDSKLSTDRLRDAVTVARDTFSNTRLAMMTSNFPLGIAKISFATYEATNIRLESNKAGFLDVTVGVDGFDQQDLSFQYQFRVGPILDLLTCWTNCLVRRYPDANQTATGESEKVPANSIWVEDEEWIDGLPLVRDRVALSTYQLSALQAYVNGELPLTDPLIGAARHFREGLELYETYRKPGIQASGDLVRALFMSALEVASLHGAEEAANCSQCGQARHKISARVRELGLKHLGSIGKDLFGEQYQDRSGFLHAGEVSGSYPAQDGSCPQLDPKSETGCAMPTSQLEAFNLREFCSFVLRKETRSRFNGRS